MADWPHPLLQSSIDVCKIITSNKFTYRRMNMYPWQIDTPIDHRSKLHCYMKEVSHITECTYTHDRLTPLPCYTVTPSPCQLTMDPCNTITPHKSHQVHNAHIPMADPYTIAVSHVIECHGRLTPPLLQLSIYLLKTSTPNNFHI